MFLDLNRLAASSAVASGNRDPSPNYSIGYTQAAFGLQGIVDWVM